VNEISEKYLHENEDSLEYGWISLILDEIVDERAYWMDGRMDV